MSFVPYTNDCPTPYTEETGTTVGMVGMSPGGVGAMYFHINPWNSSGICNIVNVGVSLQFSMSSAVIQTCSNEQNNQIVTKIDCNSSSASTDQDNQCDKVVISNNTYFMTNQANMQNTQASYKSNDAQKILYLYLLSYLSCCGKYLLQFPSTLPSTTGKNTTLTNVINAFLRLSISINTNIEQTCTSRQHNIIDISVSGYNEVYITNNSFKQINSANMKCTQYALQGNPISKQVVAILNSMSAADPKPQTSSAAIFSTMMICLIFLIIGVAIIQIGKSLQNYPPLVSIFFGFVFIAIFLFMKHSTINVKSGWFGFSPGIPSINHYEDYFELQETIEYNDANEAQKYCDSKPEYVAMDYTINPDSIIYNDSTGLPSTPGIATFYTGNVTQTLSACHEITQGLSTTTSPLYVSYRHAYFRNGNLANNVPDESIIGDVALDVLTGKLWFRMPYDPVNGFQSYSGQNSSWVQPDKIDDSNTNSIAEALNKLGRNVSGASYYFWIDPTLKETFVIDQYIPLDTRYQAPLDCNCNDLIDCKPIYSDNQSANLIKEGDYFILPFPYGEDATDETFELYAYNQKFGVYNVKLNSTTNKWEPDMSNGYILLIGGYGLVPVVQNKSDGDSNGNGQVGTTATYLKYEQVYYALLWTGLGLIGIGILMGMFIGVKHYNSPDIVPSPPNQTINPINTQTT